MDRIKGSIYADLDLVLDITTVISQEYGTVNPPTPQFVHGTTYHVYPKLVGGGIIEEAKYTGPAPSQYPGIDAFSFSFEATNPADKVNIVLGFSNAAGSIDGQSSSGGGSSYVVDHNQTSANMGDGGDNYQIVNFNRLDAAAAGSSTTASTPAAGINTAGTPTDGQAGSPTSSAAATGTSSPSDSGGSSALTPALIGVSVVVVVLILGAVLFYLWRKRLADRHDSEELYTLPWKYGANKQRGG
ncbi:hypothetical protein HK101_006550, partial [Irineochytrium annulatum]